MFDLDFKLEDLTPALEEAADKAAFRNFGHAAASIRKDAASTIERSREPSEPGQPPHTRRGQLPRAIRYAVDELGGDVGAVVGPRASLVGESGAAHEIGGEYKGTEFPERPFMGPALERALPRFAEQWRGSIGE